MAPESRQSKHSCRQIRGGHGRFGVQPRRDTEQRKHRMSLERFDHRPALESGGRENQGTAAAALSVPLGQRAAHTDHHAGAEGWVATQAEQDLLPRPIRRMRNERRRQDSFDGIVQSALGEYGVQALDFLQQRCRTAFRTDVEDADAAHVGLVKDFAADDLEQDSTRIAAQFQGAVGPFERRRPIRLVGEEDGRTSTDPESIAERVDFDFIQPQGTESGL